MGKWRPMLCKRIDPTLTLRSTALTQCGAGSGWGRYGGRGVAQASSFLRSNALTWPGLALPLLAFMT